MGGVIRGRSRYAVVFARCSATSSPPTSWQRVWRWRGEAFKSAVIVSSFLFAVQHFWQLYNVPRLALIWLVLGPIVVWKRNLRIGVVAHGAGNVVNAILVLVSVLGT